MFYKIIAALTGLALFACSNVEPNKDPNPLYGTDGRHGTLTADTLYAKSNEVIRSPFVNTILSSKLSLGSYDGLQAGFEVSFSNLPADSISVDSAFMEITTIGTFGPNKPEKISATMYKILKEWKSDSVNVDEIWRNPLEASFVAEEMQVQFNTEDSAKTRIDVQNIFDFWRSNSSTNYGAYIHANDEDLIMEFSSRNASIAPKLIYYRHIGDSVISDTLLASSDATVFNYDETAATGALDLPANQFLISSGVVSKSLLQFDFSALPKDALFYSVDLILTEDDENMYENSGHDEFITLKPLEKKTDKQADYVFNPNRSFSLKSDAGVTKISGIYKTDLAMDFIQPLSNSTFKNNSLLIEFLSVDDDLSVKRFWGSNADMDKRPHLIIKYLKAQK